MGTPLEAPSLGAGEASGGEAWGLNLEGHPSQAGVSAFKDSDPDLRKMHC